MTIGTMKTIAFDSPDRVAKLLADLPMPDAGGIAHARTHQANLTKPLGALGRLEDIAVWLAGWQAHPPHLPRHPHCLVFAGNHGITRHKVSAYPQEVTAQMVANFKTGGAAINQLTKAMGVPLTIHPIRLDDPTHDITTAPAMSLADTLAAMQIGGDAIPQDCDMLLLGEMGIGNTAIASALAAWVLGREGEVMDWVGAGSGLDSKGIQHKANIIAKALQRHHTHTHANKTKSDNANADAVALLASLGGRELAAIAGAVLVARSRRIPVLLDGFVATCACLPLWQVNRHALLHCQISHVSAEAAHGKILARLGMEALCDLNMRLGEASGAVVAFSLVKLALAVHTGMASFDEAGVAKRDAP